MKIGIIGSGVVGKQLGIGFLRIGHEVKLGTRDTGKLSEWLREAGAKASVGSAAESAKFGDVVIIATGWEGTENAIRNAGIENFAGKTVIDVTNPLDHSQGPPPRLAVSYGNSAGEQVQKWLPESKVVKAFNTISAHIMIKPHREDGEPDLFIAGNDDNAKKEVTLFAEQLGWKSIIDMGDISNAYWLETFAMLWITYGFKYGIWTHAFKLMKK